MRNKSLLLFLILCVQQLLANNCLNEDETEFLQVLINTNPSSFKEAGWSFDNDFTDWKGLTVSNCSITAINLLKIRAREIPNEIVYLQNLESIKIPFDDRISRNLFSLPKLTTLHIEGYSLPKKTLVLFHRLKNLKHLKLKVAFKTIPKELLMLSNLEYLDLSENYLESLSDEIHKLTKLKHIDLSRNTYLKGELNLFNAFENLRYLNLAKTRISGWFVPSSKHLSHLDLSDIDMRYGNLDISKTKNIKTLKIRKVGIKEIKGISLQSQLKIVDLSDNFLTDTKEFSLENSTQIDSLNISKNDFTSIPKLGNSPNYVNISSNPIFSIQKEDFNQIKNTITLDMSFMSLDVLPEAIAQLKKCTTLNISNNNLTELPKVLSELTQLEKLDIRRNKLAKLSFILPNLKELVIGRNNFSEVPLTVFQHLKLETFYIDGFELKSVPKDFLKLKSLKDLYVPFYGDNDEVLCDFKKRGIAFKSMYYDCKN